MDKINRYRIKKPECLIEKANEWTLDWKTRHEQSKGFTWHQYKKRDCQTIINKALSKLTDSHCSYCGIYPLGKGQISATIDHFKPKSIFLDLAFEWNNLFLACGECQKYKGNFFPNDKEQIYRNKHYHANIEPLKPDEIDYSFDYWFKIIWKTNKIVPNNKRTIPEKKKAIITIDFFGLNEDGRPQARELELEKYKGSNNKLKIEFFSYRFFLTRA